MRIPLRTVVISLAVIFTYGGIVLACPDWSHGIGLDFWNSSRDERELAAYKSRAVELDAVGKRVMKRLEMKEVLVLDLIDEQIDLEQAADQFLALNNHDPELTSYVRMHFEGNDDHVQTANQVIAFARAKLVHDPSREQTVLRRLNYQLRVMKGRKPVVIIH